MASTLVQMSHIEVKSKCGRFQMRKQGEDTGYLCLFMNELFDSVNGDGSEKKMKSLFTKNLFQRRVIVRMFSYGTMLLKCFKP